MIRKARTELTGVIAHFLSQQARPLLHQLMTHAIPTGASLHVLAGVDHLRFDWLPLMHAVEPILRRVAQDGVQQATKQITRYKNAMKKADESDLVNLENPRATDWAHARAAELVGKKILPDGQIVDNPDAKWAISESTREKIREQVEQAIDRGDSNDELASAIENSYAFSPERAEVIARTETAFADVQGNLIGYADMGVTKKESIKSDLHDEPDECDDNEEGGEIPIDDDFPSGDSSPPYHPNCECDLLPVLDELPTGDDTSAPDPS
ncbi:MAG: phage minor head protein [Burkholderiales bacterium]